uniref:Uncharacterized protein n=1 Tax=Leersia perrieri TaxID=77586 RepID=A0A0D9V3R2_9ORYZ
MTASAVVAPPQIRQFSTAAAAVAPLPTSPVSPMRPRIRNDVVTSVLAALSPHRRPLCGDFCLPDEILPRPQPKDVTLILIGCNFFGVEEVIFLNMDVTT